MKVHILGSNSYEYGMPGEILYSETIEYNPPDDAENHPGEKWHAVLEKWMPEAEIDKDFWVDESEVPVLEFVAEVCDPEDAGKVVDEDGNELKS